MINSIRVFKDGDSWVAVLPDFIDLQVSNTWWGNTPQEAVLELVTKSPTSLDYFFD